jgi:type I restriction enzyme S subunit
MNQLPQGWYLTNINNISIKGTQKTPAEHEYITYVDIGCIDRKSKNIVEPQYLLGKDAPSRARKVINTNDVLVSLTRPNLNAVAHIGEELDNQFASTGFEVIKSAGVESRFIFFLTRTKGFIEEISGATKGALYPAAKSEDVRKFEFALPPLNEQIRIANKLDSLLAKVDTAQARLEKIPTLLKRFRQSVLAAATSGELTREWREENSPDCIQDYSLKTAVERKNKGIRETKHSKNAAVDKEPFEIPSSWQWIRLGHIALKITDGAHNTPQVLDSGYPYLMAKDLTRGVLDFSENRFISEKDHRELYCKCLPELGDLLVVNIGAGTGNNVLINVDFEFSFKNIAIIKRPIFVVAEYLKYFFDAEKKRIFDEQTRGGAQPFLSLTMLNDIPFALPSIEEQTEIVRRVESLFALADTVEKQYLAAKQRLDRLSQSLLAKAFRGELVPQDPNDEPAAELLKRIQAERQAQPAPKQKRSKPA